jgi:hypothetical protein
MGAPVAIIVTDQNGNAYTISGTTSGTHVMQPLPVVLTDVNGNALQFTNPILPEVVYSSIVSNQNAVSNAYATAYTTTAAGLYRIQGTILPTTMSSSAWAVEIACSLFQNGVPVGQNNQTYELNSCAIGTAISSANYVAVLAYLSANQAIGFGTFTLSGSNTGGVFRYAITIERLA